MPVINNRDVYNYYLATYGPTQSNSRFDSHKKDELKDVYKRIVNKSKDAPLYKIKMGSEVAKFAIDLKETARGAQNVVSSLQTESDDIESVFYKKIATSSDRDAIDVEYVGNEETPSTPEFSLGVQRLASPQVNTGNYLDVHGHSFEEGSYTFDLDTPTNSYEFQFNVGPGDTNRDVQQKISRLINTSDVGVTSQVLVGDGGTTTALELTSKNTGLTEGEEYLFNISSQTSFNELNTLGIANITSPAENSLFTLNGREHSSLSNSFTINQAFEVSLKSPTAEGADAHIGFKANTEAIADSAQELINSYNNFVSVGKKYSESHNNSQLIGEMGRIYRGIGSELESVGIRMNDDMTLSLDRERITEAVSGDDAKSSFASLNHFKSALLNQANKTSIDPLSYVDKIPVEYKNPGKNFPAPYATSRYAGLMVDQSL